MKFVVFREINQRWYWELRTADGERLPSARWGTRPWSSASLQFSSFDSMCLKA